eukprot:gnl/TRDRNA2_/TRDRNA2_43488_c0_seq1.p1 gnl/TRDRNA2_/TRDRNA2_43488_c0~~gnl/TRDRNA2_/TRDRNA2_43488_c0_seq1.p1  ORF type:complete len:442 (+),score=50.68 gnl/TRDRNA2_/TRDRNA2_43488_c0_seq1:96-1328(+)
MPADARWRSLGESCSSDSEEGMSSRSGSPNHQAQKACADGPRWRHGGPWAGGPLPPWVHSLTDSILVAPEGIELQTGSLPAVLSPREGPSGPRPPPGRQLRLSQARLIIPRTVSEYFECCRFSRSHSEGLLFASTTPDAASALAGCRDVAPRALSEGLLGGRLCPPDHSQNSGAQGQERKPVKQPPIPVERLAEGKHCEGTIVRVNSSAVFVEIGAEKPGMLRRRLLKGLPRRFLQKGETLANLYILHIDNKRRRFTLGWCGVDGDLNVEEVDYGDVLLHVADWAGVKIPSTRSPKSPEPADGGSPCSAAAAAADGQAGRPAALASLGSPGSPPSSPSGSPTTSPNGIGSPQGMLPGLRQGAKTGGRGSKRRILGGGSHHGAGHAAPTQTGTSGESPKGEGGGMGLLTRH